MNNSEMNGKTRNTFFHEKLQLYTLLTCARYAPNPVAIVGASKAIPILSTQPRKLMDITKNYTVTKKVTETAHYCTSTHTLVNVNININSLGQGVISYLGKVHLCMVTLASVVKLNVGDDTYITA